jgi:hypothetical protein
MPCPYLAEVTMVYCRAVPVKKLVPSDRITSSSQCGDDCFPACAVFREALERAGRVGQAFDAELSNPSAEKKGVQS